MTPITVDQVLADQRAPITARKIAYRLYGDDCESNIAKVRGVLRHLEASGMAHRDQTMHTPDGIGWVSTALRNQLVMAQSNTSRIQSIRRDLADRYPIQSAGSVRNPFESHLTDTVSLLLLRVADLEEQITELKEELTCRK